MESQEALSAEVVSPEENVEMASLIADFCECFGGIEPAKIDYRGEEWRDFLKRARGIDPMSNESDLLSPEWFKKFLPEGAVFVEGEKRMVAENEDDDWLYSAVRMTMSRIIENQLKYLDGPLPQCLKDEPPPLIPPRELLVELRGLNKVKDSEEIFKKLNLIRDHLLRSRLIDLESYFNLKEIIEGERGSIKRKEETEEWPQ